MVFGAFAIIKLCVLAYLIDEKWIGNVGNCLGMSNADHGDGSELWQVSKRAMLGYSWQVVALGCGCAERAGLNPGRSRSVSEFSLAQCPIQLAHGAHTSPPLLWPSRALRDQTNTPELSVTFDRDW